MTIEEKVLEIIADVLDLDVSELNAAMGPEDVEDWDSVNALRILTSIETDLHVRLSLEQFAGAKTIGELASLLESKHIG